MSEIDETWIETKDLTVFRQKKAILKNVSLKITARDFVTIIGPNGAGKSTLLKCLLGIYPADRGEIKRKKQLKIGYVPQRLFASQFLPMTVERFLTLGKKTDPDDKARVIEKTNISRLIKKQLFSLSGGEVQFILLARALIGNPELLVLDEPTQSLDIPGQLAFYKLLDSLYKSDPISIVMVSHDLHMVMASTKQVICLFHHICCSGSPKTVTKTPEFIALFGNDMAKMMALYNHHHDHRHSDDF